MSENKSEETLATPEGDLSLSVTESENSPQKIVPASKEELADFHRLASLATEFVSSYHNNDSENVSLQKCDEAFTAWLVDSNSKYSDEEVVSILGAYLGETCCEDLDMEWVVVSDQFGTDYAVRSTKFETLGFPFSSVAKRIESRETEFLVGVYRVLENNIADGKSKKR